MVSAPEDDTYRVTSTLEHAEGVFHAVVPDLQSVSLVPPAYSVVYSELESRSPVWVTVSSTFFRDDHPGIVNVCAIAHPSVSHAP